VWPDDLTARMTRVRTISCSARFVSGNAVLSSEIVEQPAQGLMLGPPLAGEEVEEDSGVS
jgi:hypothetical protein